MKNLRAAFFTIAMLLAMQTVAQRVTPTAYYTDKDGEEQAVQSIEDGEAPLTVTFKANPEDADDYQMTYQWVFQRQGSSAQTYLFTLQGEEAQYTFTESGTYRITLNAYKDTDTEPLDAQQITVVITTSKLEFPNAFSPNGDGINDVYKAKDGWRSIVEFHAYIFNRWGQKLYEWHDPSGSWDGKHNGHDVSDGVYYILVKARGADGRKYNIRKDINLLRGYIERSGSSTSN